MKKKIYKALSIILSLIIVFSACLCVFNTVSAASEETYYVSPEGDDTQSGKTPRFALATVAKAIEVAKTAGYTTGDTVTINVLESSAVSWGTASSPVYLPEHNFKLVITSDDGTGIVGEGNKNINFGGDVDFKNVKLNFGNSYHSLCSNGHNITFDSNCTYSGNKAMSQYLMGAWNDTQVFNEDFTLTTQMPIGLLSLTNHYSSTTFNGDINVNYNALSGAPTFWLGTSDIATTYNGAVNLNVNAASVSFTKRTGAVNFGTNGYMQILNCSATVLTATGTALANVPSDKLLIVNNTIRASDLLSFTDTKGRFKVNTSVYSNVKATSAADPTQVITAQAGYLTLPAGEYNVTADKIPQNVTYYAKKDGTGDGSSADTPIGTVAAAVSKAVADGYIVNDTVTVKVMGTEIDLGTMPAYPFDLVIDSNDSSVRTKIIAEGSNIANGMGATTTYKNVELYRSGEYKSLYLNSSDVVFESSCKISGKYLSVSFGSSAGGNNQNGNIPGQTVVMNCAPSYDTFLTNWLYSSRTYTAPVTYIVNNINATPYISFNSFSEGKTNGNTTFKKALNLGIYSAKSVTFKSITGVTFEEGLQIINGSATVVSTTDTVLSSVPSDKLYILNNVSGDSKLLEFTDTVGKYKVNLVNPEHKVIFENAEGVKTYYDNSGYVTLPAGTYTVSIERDPYFVDYYVDPEGIEITSGSRPATAGTKENPVRTFADATRLIAQDGLAAMDVATVHLKEGVRNYWKNENEGDATYNVNPANYNCTVVIDSSMPDTVAELYSYNAISLTGDLVLRNVDFTVSYQWADCSMAGYDLTIDETASLSCPYLFTWKTEYGKTHRADQTLIVNGVLTTGYVALAAPYHNHTSTGDFNFYYNNVNSAASLVFGPRRDAAGPNVYEGNININVKQAKTLSFAVSESEGGAEIKGSLQVLVDDSVNLPYSVKTNFENFNVAGGKWYITNAATDDDFVTFTDTGVLSVKNGATAYSRQLNKDQVKHTGGTIDLSAAPGAYTVSNKAIAPLTDDSHKMLYFLTGATSRFIGTRAKVTPGETYRFEYTIYSNFYEDSRPRIRDDGDRGQTCEVKIISTKQMGDCYRVVCEGTIPETYDKGSTAFFGVQFTSYSEGILFDRTVYNVKDPDKKDCFEANQNFHSGLDYVSLDFAFWGAIFTDSRGGRGLVKWAAGLEQLEVMNYDLAKVAEIKKLNNPDDGEWWDKSDIKEEEVFGGTATVKGTFKYQDGTPIKGQKMLLISEENSYTDTTDKNGNFSFKDVPAGFYDLYLVSGSDKIHTGFSTYLSDGDVVKFDVINDVSGITVEDSAESATDYESTTETEEVEEIIPSGNLTGTVYTPQLDTVANLKIVLDGVGEVVTADDGTFGFANIPVGEYTLYAVNSDGSKYEFRTVNIKENVNLSIKLKYDPPIQSDADESDNGWIIWVIVASIVALLVVAALAFFVIFKKKKAEQV